MTSKKHLSGILGFKHGITIFIFFILTVLIAISVGRMFIPFAETIKIILNLFGASFKVDELFYLTITSIRLPRIIMAALVGSGLSVAGVVFQNLFSNPLASPDTIGVASGASLGAAVAIILGLTLLGTQVFALLFGLLAIFLTYISGGKRRTSIGTLVLSGIMISSLFSGLISLVKYIADTESQLPAITYFLMGSLNGAGYKSLIICGPVIVICIVILFMLRWRLNILTLSEDEAKTSGVNISRLRTISVILVSAITASCVSMCGQVGWVGLLVPHICRMKFGNNNLSLIPSSIGLGAIFLIIVDTLARTISPAEIPVSVLTSVIGAPFFIFLMHKGKGWQL